MKGFLIGLIVAAVGGVGVTAFAMEDDKKVSDNSLKQEVVQQGAVTGTSNKFCDDDCRGEYHDDDCRNNPKYIELRNKIENDLVANYGDNWHETLRAQYGSEWDDVIEDKYEKVYGDKADDVVDDIIEDKFGDDDCDDHDDHCTDDDCLDDVA